MKGGETMPRKAKVTNEEDDRKDQRDRTEHLKDVLAAKDKLSEQAPAHLAGDAKKLWETIVPELNATGYVIGVDASEVETLAMNYQMLREAYESVKDNGITYMAGGKMFKNPAVGIIDSTTKVIKSIGSDLGLSPQSRATLIDMAATDDDDAGEDLAKRFGA